MGFVDSEMISYLMMMTSIFMVSPALALDNGKQRQLEFKFNRTLARNNITDPREVFTRALLK